MKVPVLPLGAPKHLTTQAVPQWPEVDRLVPVPQLQGPALIRHNAPDLDVEGLCLHKPLGKVLSVTPQFMPVTV